MVWQHEGCVWYWNQAGNAAYFCEQCRPDLHPDPITYVSQPCISGPLIRYRVGLDCRWFRFQHPKPEGEVSYPPPSHAEPAAHFATDYLTATKQRFLHPTKVVPTARGHHGGGSSGSRDRGVGRILGTLKDSRTSPYPSPHSRPYPSRGASLLLGYDLLPTVPPQNPLVSLGIEQSGSVSVPVYGASSFGSLLDGIEEPGVQLDSSGSLADDERSPAPRHVPGIDLATFVPTVNNPDVANTAMRGISGRQRKVDANFVCPVPGCGSTLTSYSNLGGA